MTRPPSQRRGPRARFEPRLDDERRIVTDQGNVYELGMTSLPLAAVSVRFMVVIGLSLARQVPTLVNTQTERFLVLGEIHSIIERWRRRLDSFRRLDDRQPGEGANALPADVPEPRISQPRRDRFVGVDVCPEGRQVRQGDEPQSGPAHRRSPTAFPLVQHHDSPTRREGVGHPLEERSVLRRPVSVDDVEQQREIEPGRAGLAVQNGESNTRLQPYGGGALPVELCRHKLAPGFEPGPRPYHGRALPVELRKHGAGSESRTRRTAVTGPTDCKLHLPGLVTGCPSKTG